MTRRGPIARVLAAAALLSLLRAVPVSAQAADAGAGNWQMIVLTGPTQIAVPAPLQETHPDYRAELTAARRAQTLLTRPQRSTINYWSQGGVLRWNEIMLELVARANLPPAPGPDGTYPVPDANNPFADPQFPFGNPPYAARAYSYVAVAQYEALKVAWYYKYLYNRRAPYQVDNSIQSLMPATTVPAYPSEDAVVSGVTAELLKLLFPTAVEQITLKAGEQRQAALLSGRASASDIAAGLALGQAVAAVFVARAGADGMRTAGGSPALWQALADAATARGETPWISREDPPRPPMLPQFRAVRAWMMTPDDILAERPGPPPSTSSPVMERELAEVKSAVDKLRARHRLQMGRWCEHADTARALELHRRTLHPRSEVQRGANRARVCTAQHGVARCRGWLLGHEIRVFQSAPVTARSVDPNGHWPAELSLVYVRPFDLFLCCGNRPGLPVSECGDVLRGTAR
jgi:hypothetical protein